MAAPPTTCNAAVASLAVASVWDSTLVSLPTKSFWPIAVPPTTCSAATALDEVAPVVDSTLVSPPINNLLTIPTPPSTWTDPSAELVASNGSLNVASWLTLKVPFTSRSNNGLLVVIPTLVSL